MPKVGERGRAFRVVGDTYPQKEKLKALGAGWEAVLRAWVFVEPDKKLVKKVEALGLSLEEI